MALTVLIILLGIAVSQQKQKTLEEIQQEEQQKLLEMQNQYLEEENAIQEYYKNYEKQISAQYEAIERAEAKRLKEMEDKIRAQWNDTKMSTKKEYVDYEQDFKSRASVDFEEGKVEIEVVQEKKNKDKNEAVDKLRQKLEKLVEEKGEDKKPMLSDQLQDAKGKKITPKNADDVAKDITNTNTIKEEKIRGGDGKIRYKYTLQLNLVPNHLRVRLEQYKDEIIKQSRRFKLDPSLVCAIIHTESYFNPKAKSHVPAYGLMQLVPKSGARDAYYHVYKKDRLLRSNYLYNPSNNIELGCGYIALLKFGYLKKVQGETKNDLCAICAYNTGAGNVARAINGTTNINKASAVINAKSDRWLENQLLRNLPYDETKNYLKKVTERREIYKKAL